MFYKNREIKEIFITVNDNTHFAGYSSDVLIAVNYDDRDELAYVDGGYQSIDECKKAIDEVSRFLADYGQELLDESDGE